MSNLLKKSKRPEKIAQTFFKEFASLEFALKKKGYRPKSSSKDRATVDWQRVKKMFLKFCDKNPDKISPTEMQAIDFLFEAPPKIQISDENNNLKWNPVFSENKFDNAIVSLKNIRNNLVHGGKGNNERLIGGI